MFKNDGNRCCSDVLLYNQIQLRHKNEKESCHKKKKKKERTLRYVSEEMNFNCVKTR